MWLQLQLENKPTHPDSPSPARSALHWPLFWEGSELSARRRKPFKWKTLNCPLVFREPPATRTYKCDSEPWQIYRTYVTRWPSAHLSLRTLHAICFSTAQRRSCDLEVWAACSSWTYICVYIYMNINLISVYMWWEWGKSGPTCMFA